MEVDTSKESRNTKTTMELTLKVRIIVAAVVGLLLLALPLTRAHRQTTCF